MTYLKSIWNMEKVYNIQKYVPYKIGLFYDVIEKIMY